MNSHRVGQLLTLACCAIMFGASARADYLVHEIGSFYIGGHEVRLTGLPQKEISFTAGMAPVKVDPNGEFETGQMYVQYVKLAEPKARFPLLMWHGGGLTGVTWETKPDGKPGWEQFFLNAGHDVYVSDAVERGRASWSRYPEIYSSEPFFRPMKEAWELFRIGPPGSYDHHPTSAKRLKGSAFRSRPSTSSRKNPCRDGPATTRQLRRLTMPRCRRFVRASSSCTAKAAILATTRR